MGITPILFWILFGMALFSALMVITSKNPMHSVIWLIMVFFAGGRLLLVLIAALRKVDIDQGIVETRTGDIGLIENLGKALFTEYVVPFEISSILFLSAIVGAVVIGKKE